MPETKVDFVSILAQSNLLNSIPCAIFLKDTESRFIGCNKFLANLVEYSDVEEIKGKTDEEMPWGDETAHYRASDLTVMKNERMINETETVRLHNKKITVHTTKAPLYFQNKMIGIIGCFTDITQIKRDEEALKKTREKADAMNAAALQVAHDIRSPLAAIMMLTQACAEIPEAQRICLREAVDRIHDIADQLLTKHRKDEVLTDSETLLPVMISTTLLSIIASKRVEYQHSKIKILFEASAESYFAFIHANITELKRMVSNLMNNSKEALRDECGEIRVTLNTNKQHLIIQIIDTGRGMSEEKIQQILNEDTITTEKENGFGLGLTHAKKMLKNFNAALNIYSSPAIGTTMELMFNLAPAPTWMANTIEVNSDDCVVVLDDDQSIHGAWDEIFSESLKENTFLKLKHFAHANECIDYINSYVNPEKLLLLTDYELIGQTMDGLNVIEETQTQRAILVTSHYENRDVLKRVVLLKTKILPKMLASHAKLIVTKKEEPDLIQVDLVLLDDDTLFPSILASTMKSRGKTIKHYTTPQALLEEISRYAKNTKICTDFDLKASMTGPEVAKILHEQGFTNLYLATGYDFKQEEMPDYLQVLGNKVDILAL
ncbi:MAG: PAS domain-containing sensor histidine kinase [Pseudomonadota bacterium]